MEPITPRRTSSLRGAIRPSATFIGTPTEWNMSGMTSMTSGKQVRATPMGWWAATAETVLPFSLSLSASRTSAGPTSIPHMIVSASAFMASSARAEKRESAYGFHRRSWSNSSFLSSGSLSYASLARSSTLRTSDRGRGSLDMPASMAIL